MPTPQPPKRRRPASFEPRVRRGALRVSAEVAHRLHAGHPFVFRDALLGRPMREPPGEVLEVLDPNGELIGRGLYDPEGSVAVRMVSRDPDERIGADAFARRVRAAARLREALLPQQGLTAYRVLNGEGDGVPGLTVDRYGDYLVAHLYTAAVEPIRDWVYDALETTFRPKAIYEQRRFRPLAGEGMRGPATMVRGELAPVELEVEEGGLRFFVDVTAPLGTGLFPDLREGREIVGARARGRRVLNLFSYTGAISVYAARGGAKEVVSVDLAQKAHARARRNFEINGLSETAHEFIAGDAFKVLAKMAERRRQFDLIVLDPPSFAQTKARVFSVQRDYCELVAAAMEVAAPGALFACVSNTHKLSLDELDRAIGEAAGRAARYARIVGRCGLPPDFPVPAGFNESHYLKFLLCAVA